MYPVIGDVGVAVPTHTFKAILAQRASDGRLGFAAFIVPNRPIHSESNSSLRVSDFMVTRQELENMSGLTLFPEVFHNETLPSSSASDVFPLCRVYDCEVSDKAGFAPLFRSAARLRSAESIPDLNNRWAKIQSESSKSDGESKVAALLQKEYKSQLDRFLGVKNFVQTRY